MKNPATSVIIPSRGERFLEPTTRDVLEKATGRLEVIVILDGYWPPPEEIVPGVRYIQRGEPQGMRPAINAAAAVARGEFLLKADGHCLFSEGFDTELTGSCEADWIMVPRRKRLDAENWCVQEVNKPDIDYMYVSFPDDPQDFGGPGLNGKLWEEKNRDPHLKSVEIDDLMSSQGSAWFMPRQLFYDLELMDDNHYGTFWNEMQELGFKVWLSGRRMVVNKRCWYAHLHKGKTYGRGYRLSENELIKGATFTKNWMFNRAWGPKQTLPFSWIIEKFWPLPGWSDDWRERIWGAAGEPWPPGTP